MARRFSEDCLIIASHNAGKVREIDALLQPFGVTVRSAGELGLPSLEETGDTFTANAVLKAEAAAMAAKLPALSDDSGLAVEALDGAPGIYSARWGGPEKDFDAAMRKVEDKLTPQDSRPRTLYVFSPSLGRTATSRRSKAGSTAHLWPPRGALGFGYDPMFLPDGRDETFGEMDQEAKHRISHRADAFQETRRRLFCARRPAMEPFGVYVHWPFCASKCPYCDFNSHVRDTIDQERWCDALLREIETTAESAPKRPVTSIFFGGGTPSLMPPDTVAAVIARIESVWGLAETVEVTLEANPTSVEAGKFADLAQAGINRVSSAFNRWTTLYCSFSAAVIAPARQSPPSRWRPNSSGAIAST